MSEDGLSLTRPSIMSTENYALSPSRSTDLRYLRQPTNREEPMTRIRDRHGRRMVRRNPPTHQKPNTPKPQTRPAKIPRIQPKPPPPKR